MSLLKSKKLKTILQVFGIIAIILTLMPFIAVDYWWIRMFDFPHLQLSFLTLTAILTYIIKFDFKNYRDYIFITVLVGCFIFQFYKIFPYTKFASFELLNASSKTTASVKLYAANVLQKNDNATKLMLQIKEMNADILLFTETNMRWQKDITQNLSEDYRYKVEHPLNNTYGMLLYSKLPLIAPQVRFLVSDSIPSIHTKVVLKSNDTIQLYAIHPSPPMPQENPMSTDRDSEMMQIAFLSRKSEYPVIVLGDFNDVAWSETSKLFQNVSELLDLRKGRGFFNTYNADSFLLRWPLDHVFVSKEFRHVDAKRGDGIDSDHFPFYAELSYEPELANQQQPKPPSSEAITTAKKQITKENRQDKNN